MLRVNAATGVSKVLNGPSHGVKGEVLRNERLAESRGPSAEWARAIVRQPRGQAARVANAPSLQAGTPQDVRRAALPRGDRGHAYDAGVQAGRGASPAACATKQLVDAVLGQLRLGDHATKTKRAAGPDFKRDTKVQQPAETKFTTRSGWLKRLNSAPALGQPARVGMPKEGASGDPVRRAGDFVHVARMRRCGWRRVCLRMVPCHPHRMPGWGASPCTSWEAQQSSRQWEPGWEANVAEQDEVLPYTVLDELQPLGDTTVTKDEAAWLDTELNGTFGGHPDFKEEHWEEMRAVLRRCKGTFANTPHDLTGYKGKAEHNTFSTPFVDESKAAYQRPRKYNRR
ncbi:hypothetical protein CYMTET_51140 [Cymbomonas tetramitiformis]|uniref:Uncharacterized protein n=1 Tax=Cymbomonas tetramitiformis TaxID=36881 RepID=A0AAE0BMX8_9CHLO|nr:hypothetical protein CYMTET_51140 [Cymbomonas tetramitiformis]